MANPQIEHGFTRIANEIIEELAKVPLNGTQHRIIDVVFRYTYGFNRKSHEFSINFLLKALDLKQTQYKQVCRELKVLLDMKILKEVEQPTKSNSRCIEFNKNYELWTKKSSRLISPEDEKVHCEWSKKSREPLVELDQKERKVYKENIKENIYTIFDYWNSKRIIKHQKLTEKIKRKISGTLNNYSESEIITAIDNYEKILHGDQYYWSHTWTLEEFLQKGTEKFLSDTCFKNYQRKGERVDGNGEIQSDRYSKFYVDELPDPEIG